MTAFPGLNRYRIGIPGPTGPTGPTSTHNRNLRDFGWSDTTADQTSVFQNALNDVPSVNGSIAIPQGVNYLTLGPLVLNKPVHIAPETGSMGGILINPATTTTTVFTVTSPFVSIEGLTMGPFNAGYVKQTAGSMVLLQSSAARFRMHNMVFQNFFTGITVNGNVPSVDLNAIQGYIYNIQSGDFQSQSLIHVLGGLDMRFVNITANGPGFTQDFIQSGIFIENVGDLLLSQCDIIGMGKNLLVNPSSGQSVTSLKATDCYFDSAYSGAEIITSGGQIARSSFHSCWFGSNAHFGALISGLAAADIDSVEFTDCEGFLNANDGMTIRLSKNVRLRGGRFAGNGDNGISVAANVSDFSITGVDSGAVAGLPGNTNRGIYIAPGSSDRYNVSNNNLAGNLFSGDSTTAALFDGGPETAHKVVLNNLGDPRGYRMARIESTGNLRITGAQPTYSGFEFATDDGNVHTKITAAGINSDGVIESKYSINHTYNNSGAIDPTDSFCLLNNSSAATFTLANGADGHRLTIKRLNAAVTITANLDGINSATVNWSDSNKQTLKLVYSSGLSTWVNIS